MGAQSPLPRHAFGWKSRPAIIRIKQAVAEIRKVAKVDVILAADGAIAFLERLGHRWAEEVASAWADRLQGIVRQAWNPDPRLRGFFKGTTNCLSALVAAKRHDDVLALLEVAPFKIWHYRQYGGH